MDRSPLTNFEGAHIMAHRRKDASILNALHEGVFVISVIMKTEVPSFEFSFSNQPFAQWFASSPDQIMGQSLEHCFPAQHYRAIHDGVMESYLLRKKVELEIELSTLSSAQSPAKQRAHLRLTPQISEQGADQIIGTLDLIPSANLPYNDSIAPQYHTEKDGPSLLRKTIPLYNPITGLPLRPYFLEKASSEFRRSQRYGRPFSIVIVLLDKKQETVDKHGLESISFATTALAQICETCCRHGLDSVGHIKDDEFVLLLPETPLAKGLKFKNRLQEVIARTALKRNSKRMTIHALTGLDSIQHDDISVHQIIKRAQKAIQF